jgi:hypothetical protein
MNLAPTAGPLMAELIRKPVEYAGQVRYSVLDSRRPNAGRVLFFIAFLLIGCATQQQKAIDAEIANTPILCTRGDDCEIKWGQALSWVTQNSYFKIRNSTDMLITTETSPDEGDVHASFSILKIAQGGGKYRIDFQAACNNMFTCNPSVTTLRDRFFAALEPEQYHLIVAAHSER